MAAPDAKAAAADEASEKAGHEAATEDSAAQRAEAKGEPHARTKVPMDAKYANVEEFVDAKH